MIRSVIAGPVPLALLLSSLTIPLWCAGCSWFEEGSFPARTGDVVPVPPPTEQEREELAGSTRKWLARTHQHLRNLLTDRGQLVMLTEEMTDDDGNPVDAYRYFDRDPATLAVLNKNWYGITHTAQSASRSSAIDEPAPPWPGFDDVWIRVDESVQLSGRLGFANTNGHRCYADCIVLLPGLWGDNAVLRTRDIATSLRSMGYHVLALELRGHGQVENRYPDVYYNFGVLETQDLIKVSEWLEDNHEHIRQTGMIGFCWGANLALLAAWFDGRQLGDPSIPECVAPFMDPISKRPHYQAGILAYCPVLRWEEIMELTDHQHSIWINSAAYFFQQTVRERMRRKQYREVSGNLRHLIAFEFSRSVLSRAFPVSEAYNCLRFLPYRGLPDGDKLEYARTPVLMVTAVNDPFLSAQDLPDLIARTSNPLVAGIVLRGGGHIGFAPYNRAHFYSLMVNFFDAQDGAAACVRLQDTATLTPRD